MKCLILAAGYATRLYPLTKNFPKPLLRVGEKTILDWLVDDLTDHTDIKEYIVVSNHRFLKCFEDWKEEKIREWAVRGNRFSDLRITVLDDGSCTNGTRLGAVKDIRLAVERGSINDDVLVMAGDNMLDFSLTGFVGFAEAKGASCVMCHEEKEYEKQRKTAIITVMESGRITSYEEKPEEPKGNLAVPPFYIYRKEDISRVTEALEDACHADAPGSFAAWLSCRAPMYAYQMPGKRYDIGDMAGYQYVKSLFAKIKGQ